MCPVGRNLYWKDSARLADGREIIYYDESPGLGRGRAPDRRPLGYRPPGRAAAGGPDGDLSTSGLRWDALAGEWVIIAAQRQDRAFLPPPEECPLDPSREGRLTEIPADDYDVVVFENRFPSLRGAGDQAAAAGLPGIRRPGEPAAAAGLPAVPRPGGPPETAGVPGRPGTGRCEVVCFTSDHDASFASLSPRRVRTVLEAWADRTAVLSAMPGIEQVYCFENRGEEIGVTLSHPHGQIYGYSFVTPRTGRMLRQARAHAAADRLPQRALDRVRPGGGALAARGLAVPGPAGGQPSGPRRCPARGVLHPVPGRAAAPRRAVRRAAALYRGVAPGAGW